MNGKALLLKGTGAIVGLAITAPAFAETRQAGDWGYHGMMWNGGMHWIMGPIMMLMFLIVVVAVVVIVIRSIGGTAKSDRTSSNSARRILEERFARGEIDEDEFRKKKRALDDETR